ncbi:Organic solute transporter subunit alpha/Transmembrane protein 184 [Trypanosoma melophagium]|uniref:Organic solute transporter subunit alpha/Transmembrane protein 184 n=1 Tax=Trypanosoma melophagium TaxID=715481 RepID=UPI00351A8082|nr:Organic solute transporter subunit alpha/Transmembrane protein 184 [Trypanosoma melophagium]
MENMAKVGDQVESTTPFKQQHYREEVEEEKGEKKKQRACLISSSEHRIPYGPNDVDYSPVSSYNDEEKKRQGKEENIKDVFGNDKDGRVIPLRRPQIVDRLHLMFFILSLPALLIMIALFVVLYVRDDVKAYVALCSISAVACFTATGMTCLLILCHLKAYTCPSQQRLICRIVLLVPVYAFDSFIALLFYPVSSIVAVVRDTYEAYVIYQFYFLLMEYLEGEERVLQLWRCFGTGEDYVELEDLDSIKPNMEGEFVVEHKLRTCYSTSQLKGNGTLSASTPATVKKKPRSVRELETPLLPEEEEEQQQQEKEERQENQMNKKEESTLPPERVHYMPHIFPLNHIFSPIRLDKNTLYLWKLFLTQYVFLNPLLTILLVPLYFTGNYQDGSFSPHDAYPYLAAVRTISVSFALSALVYFYFSTKAYLRVYSPTVKFLAIKAVVFLTYWQGVLLNTLVFYSVIPDSPITPAKKVTADLQNFLICLEMYGVSVAHRWIFNDDIYLIASNGQRQKLRLWVIRHVLSVSDVIDEAGSVVRMAPRTAQHIIQRRFAHWCHRAAQAKEKESESEKGHSGKEKETVLLRAVEHHHLFSPET